MRKHLLPFILTGLFIVFSSSSYAEHEIPEDYGHKFALKATSGFANMVTSVLEIPKNIINTTNDSHIVFGLTGGLAKGLLHTAARAATGAADFITAPLPTKPIAYPHYVWDDFDIDTKYGEVLRLEDD